MTSIASTERIFIDRFVVPETSKAEFMERLNINRAFIKQLDGFMGDHVYERVDEKGNFIYVTVAVWESDDAIRKAKEAVQASYVKEGFNLAAMLGRLHITLLERGVYSTFDH